MKNLKLLIVALFTTISVFANDSEKIAKESFKHDYISAKNEKWVKSGDYYLVNFDVDDIKSRAIYSEDGKLIRLIQYVTIDQMPLTIRTKIDEVIGEGKTLMNLTIISNSEETLYYARAEDNKHMYLYKIYTDGSSERVEKFKKA